jgi:hypothetical protein
VVLEERAPKSARVVLPTRHEPGNGVPPEGIRERHGANEIRKLRAARWGPTRRDETSRSRKRGSPAGASESRSRGERGGGPLATPPTGSRAGRASCCRSAIDPLHRGLCLLDCRLDLAAMFDSVRHHFRMRRFISPTRRGLTGHHSEAQQGLGADGGFDGESSYHRTCALGLSNPIPLRSCLSRRSCLSHRSRRKP